MDDLIEALTIFRKYANPEFPTHCNHDELIICVSVGAVSSEFDRDRLDELGFSPDLHFDCWRSSYFGSA